jgi:hypothetical protein
MIMCVVELNDHGVGGFVLRVVFQWEGTNDRGEDLL